MRYAESSYSLSPREGSRRKMNIRFGRVSMLLIVGLLLLAACSPTSVETPEPTSPTAAATVQPAAPTPGANVQPVVPTPTGPAPTSAASDDLAKGILLVGSSLDNPPYSTYNDQFRPAGFDVAYITEIARRLGARVDINDFTFEGLLDALKLKQVDAAIAAIDITPDAPRRWISVHLTTWAKMASWQPRIRSSRP